MIRKVFVSVVSLLVMALTQQCAQVGPLTGGKRDSSPPKLIESIPANNCTNFHGQEIILKFDEYIQLKDLTNQLVVSPQVKKMPEIETLGKMLKIKIEPQNFEPGTTYRIDFGKSIADMHESNILENFSFVFSSGPFIDTIEITGKLTLAFNNKDVADASVCLYPNATWFDSLTFKTLPSYIAKTKSNGDFHFYNLPASKYLIYAIDDVNKNSLYDGESEQIAMLGPPMFLKTDTVIDLKMFKEEVSKYFIKKTNVNNYGLAQVIFNKPSKFKVKPSNMAQSKWLFESQVDKLKDTISIYYKNIDGTLSLYIQNIATSKVDTLKLALPQKPNSTKSNLQMRINESQGKLTYGQNLQLIFSTWMDTSKLNLNALLLKSLTDSTVQKPSMSGYWSSINVFEITSKLKEGVIYELKINKNAFNSMASITNDSTSFKFKTYAKTDFGKFNLKLRVSRKQNYVLQLLNDKEEVVKEVSMPYSAFASGSATIPFNSLLPGNYAVKIIFDNNENKKWDRGDISNGRLPEPIIISYKTIKIISDWETEEEIILGEK